MQLELPFSAKVVPERVFLAERGPLAAAAVWLAGRAPAHDRVVDLQSEVVVVPTERSGRRLLEALVDRAEALDRGLLPPRILTPGALTSLSSVPPPADEIVRLAWLDAVQALPADCAIAFGAAAQTQRQALALAWLGARVDRELGAAGRDFAEIAERVPHPERYRALHRLQSAAAAQLEQWGVADPRQLGPLVLGEKARLVLLGVVELAPITRALLEPLAGQTSVLVLAPQQWQERFDAWGALNVAPWLQAELDIAETALRFASGARDQADSAVRWLGEQGPLSTRDVSFAVLDEEVTSPLDHALARAGVSAHVGLPLPFSSTAVARLLEAAAGVLDAPNIDAWATFVRHPDLPFAAALHWLDRHRAEHLPHVPVFAGIGNDLAAEKTRELDEQVTAVLGDLHGAPRSLAAWSGPLVDFLRRVYGDRRLVRAEPSDRRLLDALDAVTGVIECVAQVPAGAAMSAADALRVHLALLDTAQLAREASEDAVDIFGWLELPLDDAPLSAVVGCNEGLLPQSINADAFLPNTLRRELGLTDNDQRYARDAYILSTVLRTRRRVVFIAGRRSLVGDPLLPSRLLLATHGRTLARRVQRFFEDEGEARAAGNTGYALAVPAPDPHDEAPSEIPVTAFAEYLACPYRFYLRRVLRLRDVDDRAQEMSPRVSGSLLHEVLCDFGRSEARDATDPERVQQALRDALHARALTRFGHSPSMAVRAQLDQLELRFAPFAAWQARWAQRGWRIAHCELKFSGHMAPFEVDGTPAFLRGTLDRVDVHPALGALIFDYKTGERAVDPERKHVKRGEWVDLQLPLYRHLWRLRQSEGALGLGYITIGKNPQETGERIARWTEPQMDAAYEVARNVVRALRERRFWPMAPSAPQGFEELAVICQDLQLGDEEDAE